MEIKILSKAEDFANASAALIKMKDKHGPVRSNVNDRLYYIIEGKGVFNLAGVNHEVEKGDLIIVPKNTEYDFWGDITIFLVHVPAFKPNI